VDDGVDGTAETDYTAERDDPILLELPDPLEPAPPGAAGENSARR
jgi:SSS family solute:Na+ symporter